MEELSAIRLIDMHAQAEVLSAPRPDSAPVKTGKES